MGNRQYRIDSRTAAAGEVFIDFSFMTAGTSQPNITYQTDGTLARGLGVKSVVRTGAGTYTVTLSDNFRWLIGKTSDLDDVAGDGAYSTVGAVTNEGTTSPIAFTLKTYTAGGVATDFGPGGTGAARRCYLGIVCKNSLVGV